MGNQECSLLELACRGLGLVPENRELFPTLLGDVVPTTICLK